MVFHMLPRVVAAAAVGLAAANLGCSDSRPLSPTPAPLPSAPPALPPPSVVVRYVYPDAGPIGGNTLMRINGSGFQVGATVVVDDQAIAVTEVTPTVIVARTAAHPAGTVDLTVTNPDGQSARLSRGFQFGVFSITASPTVVAPGDALTVSFTAPTGRNCNGGGDWIAIYRVGDPDDTGASNGHSDIWYDHLCGASSGSRTLAAPEQPGDYEFRYLVWDTSVARSERVHIRGANE
jgi:IPT/TIG domain-containing protein